MARPDRKKPAKKGVKGGKGSVARDRRPLTLLVNAALFVVNFLLFYFVWVVSVPDVTGFARLVPCWLLAYGLTWLIVRFTRRTGRILITLVFCGLLAFVLTSSR